MFNYSTPNIYILGLEEFLDVESKLEDRSF